MKKFIELTVNPEKDKCLIDIDFVYSITPTTGYEVNAPKYAKSEIKFENKDYLYVVESCSEIRDLIKEKL